MYYELFLLPHSGVDFTQSIGNNTNMLDTCYRIDLLQAGMKLSLEPVLHEMGDGTALVKAETVQFECASLRVDQAEYLYLRETFHGTLSDLLLLDPHDMSMALAVYRIRLNVQHVATSGDVCLIQINGSLEAAADVIDSTRCKVFGVLSTGYALVSGTVYDESGDPIVGAAVSDDTGSYSDVANKDGRYLLILPVATRKIFAEEGTRDIPKVSVSLVANQVYEIDIYEVHPFAITINEENWFKSTRRKQIIYKDVIGA